MPTWQLVHHWHRLRVLDTGGSYPPAYNGALFFADYSRNCIWVMLAGAGGVPNPSNIQTFVQGAASPVDLQIGPNGDLFYADQSSGTIRRIQYLGNDRPPTAAINASATSGLAPLTISFDGTGSSDPDAGDTLTYAWDLKGDGTYADATTPKTSYTYTQAGTFTAGLRVTDNHGASSVVTVSILVNSPPANTPPTATISNPTASTTWKVGDPISFAGSATDKEDGALPASALSWSIILHHCPSDCHTHFIQSFAGVATGSFPAPTTSTRHISSCSSRRRIQAVSPIPQVCSCNHRRSSLLYSRRLPVYRSRSALDRARRCSTER